MARRSSHKRSLDAITLRRGVDEELVAWGLRVAHRLVELPESVRFARICHALRELPPRMRFFLADLLSRGRLDWIVDEYEGNDDA